MKTLGIQGKRIMNLTGEKNVEKLGHCFQFTAPPIKMRVRSSRPNLHPLPPTSTKRPRSFVILKSRYLANLTLGTKSFLNQKTMFWASSMRKYLKQGSVYL